MGPCRKHQVDARARRGAKGDKGPQVGKAVVARIAGGQDQVQHIVLDLFVDVYAAHHLARPQKLPGADDGADRGQWIAGHAVDDHALLVGLGIVDDHLEHEAVHLGLGQGIGALLLDGVLGGQDQEGVLQLVGGVADGDLALLHGLQQRALHLGGGAVDLVGQHEIGKEGPLVHGELTGLDVVHLGAHQVRRQQVGRELDARKAGLDGLGHGLDQQGLGQAGHAFQQDVAVGQQRDQDALDHGLLPHHDGVDVGQEVVQKERLPLHLGVQLPDACDIHVSISSVYSIRTIGYAGDRISRKGVRGL